MLSYLIFILFYYLFLETGGEREKKREKALIASNVHPDWGPGLKIRHVP